MHQNKRRVVRRPGVTYYSPESRPQKPNRLPKLLAGFFVVMTAIIVLPFLAGKLNGSRLDGIVKEITAKVYALSDGVDYKKLQADVQSDIATYPSATVGVTITNLNSGTSQNIGSSAPFNAASTTKVLTAAAFLKSVENGQNTLSEQIGNYPARYQLQQMVNQSNNDSWNLVADHLGLDNLQNYARSIGADSFNSASNTFTTADEAIVLQKLYEGKLLNSSHTQLLLSFMQQTNNEDLIPAAVPGGANVYHKYGQLDGELHDTAIISYHGSKFVLVIFTKGADGNDYSARAQLIHQITQSVVSDIAK